MTMGFRVGDKGGTRVLYRYAGIYGAWMRDPVKLEHSYEFHQGPTITTCQNPLKQAGAKSKSPR